MKTRQQRPEDGEYKQGKIDNSDRKGGRRKIRTHPWPPVLSGAPLLLSPSDMALAVVVKARGAKAAGARKGAFAIVVRNIVC